MPKPKKNSSTSKRKKKPLSPTTLNGTPRKKEGRPRGSKLKVLKGVVFERKYPGEDPHVDFKPPPGLDPERVNPEPDDDAAKLKYPPPKKNPIFRAKWAKFINNVIRRENFNVAHLDSLEILCDLHVQYDELQTFIRINGRSYLSVGRSGEMWRLYPEVSQLNRVEAQIKEYTKMLGLLLKKDHGVESDGEEEEWK